MPYKVYIDAKLASGKWIRMEKLPSGFNETYLTRTEAEKQAKANLNMWKRLKKRGKYLDWRSRIERVK